ncbi:FtsK/SpoIIIE domain-containing protein [Actinoallomurus sp. NPDC052308]|uniref:FtsK/SpoIIIE domain-containing protein n=1 Tax=Actinoallomurus sp. NPDC052308 TaxID=3155530 RepID=UPI00342127C8
MTLKPGDLVAAVRKDIRQARGAIRARRSRLDEEIAEAEAAVEQSRRDVAATSGPETAAAVAGWRELAAEAAPGAASAPWTDWPAEPEPADSGPCLYRVGTAAGEVPALVPLLDSGHLRITGGQTPVADAVVDALLVRIVATTRPGSVRVSLYDPRRLGAGLGGFHALSRPGLLTVYGVEEFKDLLGSLDRDIRRIQRDVLGGGHSSLAELAAATGRRPEPWQVVIVQSPVRGLRDDEVAHLTSVMHAGAACGIHVICRDVPVEDAPGIEAVDITADGRVTTSMTGELEVTVEPPPPELVRAVCERAARWAGIERDPPRFAELVPHRMWSESSAAGVRAPIGEDVDRYEPVEVFLGDDPVHALVGGPPGSGKTNFLYAMIGSMAARYSPDELEFYLLDFKEGVSFARLASGRTDKTWLPHARLIGVNINNDREFGLALLRFLARELERRGAAAREHEVTKLEELRAVDPDGHWPRIVAVIDEFQVLIQQQDKITDESLYLLNDLARRGRSQGIHLVLASQNVSGVQSLWGRGAILDQFTLRIALPKARRILADDNFAASQVARFCAVVNPESGARQANRIARLPDAGVAGTFDALQRELWQRRPEHLAPPRIFDGAHVPELMTAPVLPPGESAVGQLIDLAGSPATVRFDRAPGRNLAVVGTRADEAYDVLASAVLSLSRGHPPGSAVFRLYALDEQLEPRVGLLARRLADDGHEVTLGGDLPEPADRDVPEYLALFAVDAGTGRSDDLRRAIRRLVEHGPERRMHVLGWWRTTDRLKADVVERVGSVRNMDAWVALDVRDSELSPLPGGQLLSWSPRHRRALFHDQRTGVPPQPIIPFEVMSESGDGAG